MSLRGIIIKGNTTGIKRYLKDEAIAEKVLNERTASFDIIAGEIGIMSDDLNYKLQTLLGSCVSVVFYDMKLNITGMNHFLTPIGETLKFGLFSCDKLLMEMYKLGSTKESLRAKVFGGASLASLKLSHSAVGQKNADFIIDYLKLKGIKINQQDLQGDKGRILSVKPFFMTAVKVIQ